MIDFAKQSLPARFKSLFFQEANLRFTLSMMGANCSLVTLPLRSGIPKYFPKLAALVIPNMLDSSCCTLLSILEAQRIRDFSRLTFMPEALQKSSRVFATNCICAVFP